MINQTLKNRYQITKFLSKGAFGETYLAKDLDFPNHPFRVVKVLRPQNNAPQVLTISRDLFKREAEVLGKLGKHHLIPELFAYFEENQEFFLVQEWIDGEDLTTEIYNGKNLTEFEVIELLKQILTPLEYVHQNNVIHRDLKPANLMRCRHDGQIVIIDFGGVKQIITNLALPQHSIVIGTPGYSSPEQNQGFPVLASDIYAVGMIAIQALIGQFPIPQDWENLVSINPNFLDILKKMVAVDTSDRYSSATEVLKALNQINNVTTQSQVKPIFSTILSKSPLKKLMGVLQITLAIAIFTTIISVSFNFSRPSTNKNQSPPPNWTW